MYIYIYIYIDMRMSDCLYWPKTTVKAGRRHVWGEHTGLGAKQKVRDAGKGGGERVSGRGVGGF